MIAELIALIDSLLERDEREFQELKITTRDEYDHDDRAARWAVAVRIAEGLTSSENGEVAERIIDGLAPIRSR